MPRKRKEAPKGDESPAKRPCSGLSCDNNTLHWQWENDGSVWTSYSSEAASLITDAYCTGKDKVDFDVAAKTPVTVIFSKMVQKNKKTGWERRIRCAVKNSTNTDFHIWQWEDEHKNWNPYDLKVTLAIEKALVDGENEITFQAARREYKICLDDMQQENAETGVKRKIESLKIDVDAKSEQVAMETEPSTSAETKKNGSGDESVAKGSTGRGKSGRNKASDVTEAGSGEESVAKGSTGRGKSGRNKASDVTDAGSGEESVAKGSTGRGKSGRNKTSDVTEAGSGDAHKSGVRTVIMKGAAPVDPECTSKVKTAHVFSQGKNVYDAMLNQTNLSNNNNKYYLMQILEDDNRKAYSVWYRWGRVGYKGQTNLIPFGPSLEDAIDTFTKKFYDKTKNEWSDRNKFKKVSGKYDLVKVDFNAKEEPEKPEKKQKPEEIPDSKLEKNLQSLIDLICDVKKMEAAVMEMKYDAKKAPLGKLTDKQIKAGYTALKKIDGYITANDLGSKLIQACDEFYTRIPHDFGMQRPPVIRTKADVRLKMSLLEALGDIEIAMKIIKQSKIDENPLDTHYNALKCDLKVLAKTDPEYVIVEKYLVNTHAPTHNQYKMEIIDVFDVSKDQEMKNFDDKGNRMLLWHGSRLTNWVGILSQGLKIAPPEAPVTGYMFGKGVYFADMSSKSANYCFPSRSKTEGVLLICEVSLGKTNDLMAADYNADKLPPGFHSVYGKGKVVPDPKQNFTTKDGCLVPLGKPVDAEDSKTKAYTLNYNEFIVYNLNQIRMKYLLRVKFNFEQF